jgi:polyhydroxyalkanoate synthesis regulator phasin
MEGKDLQKEMLRMVKASWETYFQMLDTMQEQSEKMMELMVSQGEALQSESKNALKQWLDNAKKTQEEYKKVMEENLSKLEGYLGPD